MGQAIQWTTPDSHYFTVHLLGKLSVYCMIFVFTYLFSSEECICQLSTQPVHVHHARASFQLPAPFFEVMESCVQYGTPLSARLLLEVYLLYAYLSPGIYL